MSEGIAWSHFSIPGDFGYRGDPDKLDIDALSKSTLYAGSLVDDLEKQHIPFLVLLDSCYDGKERHFEPTVLSAEATRNLNDVGAALRVMNEFRDTYPVLFSATPGKSVPTVTNPLAPNSPVNIGPLARRFSLIVKKRLTGGQSLSLATFLDDMGSATLDDVTTPAITHSKTPDGVGAPLLVSSHLLLSSARRSYTTVVQGHIKNETLCEQKKHLPSDRYRQLQYALSVRYSPTGLPRRRPLPGSFWRSHR